jgi:hypothetical protein
MHFEFLAPVFTGDQIDTVIEMTEFDAARRLVTFKADCYNQGRSRFSPGRLSCWCQPETRRHRGRQRDIKEVKQIFFKGNPGTNINETCFTSSRRSKE